MNKIHRVLWSRTSGQFIAVAEITKSCGQSSGVSDGSSSAFGKVLNALWVLRPVHSALLMAGLMSIWTPSLAQTPASTQLPIGGQVAAGQASIAQSGSVMAITQGSNRAAINWHYVTTGAPGRACRSIGCTMAELAQYAIDGRQMLINRRV